MGRRATTAGLCLVLVLAAPGGAGQAACPPAAHVPGPGTGFEAGTQLRPGQLAWASLLLGAGLVVGGLLGGHRDMLIVGGILAPAGAVGVWRERGRAAGRGGGLLLREYDLTHFGEDMRYLFDKHPARDMIARSLIRRYPEMHRQFRFSLTAFGPPGGDTAAAAADSAFAAWYLSLRAEDVR